MTTDQLETFFDKFFLAGRRPYYWLAGIIFILYCSTLLYGLTLVDDHKLLSNAVQLIAKPEAIVKVFYQPDNLNNSQLPYYRPVLILAFLPDAILGGTSFIAHFFNIIIHAAAVYLLFILLQKLHYSRRASFIATLFFAVHPAITQAVAWIPGRNDSLLAIFVLAAFIFLINFLDKKKTQDYVWHLLFFSLALFTKESAIAFLPVAVFFTFFIKKVPLISRQIYLLAVAWFSIFSAVICLRTIALEYSADVFISWSNLPAVIQYLGKIFFPVNLSVSPMVQTSTFIYGFLSLAILALLLLLSRRHRLNYIIFGLIWFLFFLLPSVIFHNSYINFDCQYEQRIYLPLVGCLIILLEINIFYKLRINKLYYYSFFAIIIVSLFGISFSHNFIFRNMASFFENVIRYSPEFSYPHFGMGSAYYLAGRMDKAEAEYKLAIKIDPNLIYIHQNLALLYLNQNRFDEAEEELKKQIELDPYSDSAYAYLGYLYHRQKMLKKAIWAYEKQQKIKPSEETEKKLLILLQQQKLEKSQ